MVSTTFGKSLGKPIIVISWLTNSSQWLIVFVAPIMDQIFWLSLYNNAIDCRWWFTGAGKRLHKTSSSADQFGPARKQTVIALINKNQFSTAYEIPVCVKMATRPGPSRCDDNMWKGGKSQWDWNIGSCVRELWSGGGGGRQLSGMVTSIATYLKQIISSNWSLVV